MTATVRRPDPAAMQLRHSVDRLEIATDRKLRLQLLRSIISGALDAHDAETREQNAIVTKAKNHLRLLRFTE